MTRKQHYTNRLIAKHFSTYIMEAENFNPDHIAREAEMRERIANDQRGSETSLFLQAFIMEV